MNLYELQTRQLLIHPMHVDPKNICLVKYQTFRYFKTIYVSKQGFPTYYHKIYPIHRTFLPLDP